MGQLEASLANGREEERAQMRTDFEKAKIFAEAVATLRIQETALAHCDGALGVYLERIPPIDAMDRYLWNKEYVEALDADPVIGDIHRWMLADAFDASDGGASIKKLRDNLSDLNSFANKYADSILGNPRDIEYYRQRYGESFDHSMVRLQARTAISLFVVNDYLKWVGWFHTNLDKDIPLYDGDGNPTGEKDRIAWAHRSDIREMRRASASEVGFGGQKMAAIELWKSKMNFGDSKAGLPFDYPILSILRPGDVLYVKNVYGADIVRDIDEAFGRLTKEAFMMRRSDDGRSVLSTLNTVPTLAEMGQKSFQRWVAAYDILVGGTKADKLPIVDAKTLGAAEKIQDIQGSPYWKEELAGGIMGDILAVKIKAMMLGRPDGAISNMLRTVAITADTSKEQSAMVTQLWGSDSSAEFGMIAETLARLNLRLYTPKFVLAKRMLATGVTNPRYVDAAIVAKYTWIALDVAADLLGVKKKR